MTHQVFFDVRERLNVKKVVVSLHQLVPIIDSKGDFDCKLPERGIERN